jgi:hypothetical protein
MDAQQGSMGIVLGGAVIDGANRAQFEQLQGFDGMGRRRPPCQR